VKGVNLKGDLTLALSGVNAAGFSLPTTTVSKVAAEAGIDILVRFDAESIGIENAVLTITSEGMSAVAINLSAESTDDFMVLPAENITERAFTTNWTSSANATGYLLDVFVLESNGATAPVTLLEEDFQNGLPATWASVPYTDNAVSGNIRLASGSNSGKITTPAINLSTSSKLSVRARQYSNDAGAPITVALDEQTVATLTTASGNQDFLVDLPATTEAQK